MPINLLENLENRSSGNTRKAIKTAKVYSGADATYLDQDSCFKTTSAELSTLGHKFIYGINFNESVFMHAIVHVAEMYSLWPWTHTNLNELFQNYNLYIGNNPDYS